MLNNNKNSIVKRIEYALPSLSEGQAILVEEMMMQFTRPYKFELNKDSGLLTNKIVQDFGDTLRIHHCYSKQAFSKDKFEAQLERVFTMSAIPAELATRGNPGHDITIEGERISLKTEASKGTKVNTIHISKFMELGQGKWTDDPADLIGLRDRFLDRLEMCDRVLTLRQLSKEEHKWYYELVEIPIPLLMLAKTGRLEMKIKSSQVGAKPGYCYVIDNGTQLFQLYFDGGSERKLQIKALLKSKCKVHASWSFCTGEVLENE